MRMMLRVTVDTTKGNDAIKSGNMGKIIGSFMERAKPEAAYFTADRGRRCGYFFLDMMNSSQMPPLTEEFFISLGADVEFIPVMNSEELQQGLAAYAAQK